MKNTLNRFYLSLSTIVISLLFVQCNGDKTNFILKNIANEVNKSCPTTLDEITRLDSCQALPNKILRYNYTMIDQEALSSQEMEVFKLYQEKYLLSDILQSRSELQVLFDINTTFQYAYYTESGKELATITIGPDEYNKKHDIQSDKYVHNQITKIVDVLKQQLPMVDDEEEFLEIKTAYPRTLIYYVKKNNIVKPAPFDSIAFIKTEKEAITKNINNNIFSTLIDSANISYQYKYIDKEGEYLCTLSISPEDY